MIESPVEIETSNAQTAPSHAVPLEVRDVPRMRPGVVFSRTLRDNLMGVAAWGAAYSTLIVIVVILYPILEENNMLLGVLNGLGLIDMIGRNYPVDVNALASFPGYLAFEALGWGPTILAVYIIPQALNAVMGEEQRGTLDLLMSTPLTRWQLMTEKALAIIVSVAGILLISWLSLLISSRIVEGTSLALWQATSGIWHIFPITMVMMSVTLLLSVLVRSPRVAGSLAALFVIGSFFLRSIADATGAAALDALRKLSIYDYYSSIGAMIDGIRWENDLTMIGVALVIYLLAVWRFQRRDLGV